jgi:glutamate-1-semialdehyde 2,1-aminomutase
MAKAAPLPLDKSRALLARALERIPTASQTFGKAPAFFPQGSYPAFIERSAGARATDVDGNRFVDCIMALGAVTLGHGHPAVTRAIAEELGRGTIHSLSHPLELRVAELLRESVPCAEMSRFFKTGAEATSAAIRICRAATGREKIATSGYHGWHDTWAAHSPLGAGIPASTRELVVPFDFNSIESLAAAFKAHPGQIAAVILEPYTHEAPGADYLSELVDLAHREGALVVFDEIITGFRVALGGAQALHGARPDLATLGKGMANGMPIYAVVGLAETMALFDRTFITTTFGGETLSLAASVAAIETLRTTDALDRLAAHGTELKRALREAATGAGIGLRVEGPAARFRFMVEHEGRPHPIAKLLFLQECVRRGLLFIPGFVFVSAAHGPEELGDARRALAEAARVVREGLDTGSVEKLLDGRPLREPVRH